MIICGESNKGKLKRNQQKRKAQDFEILQHF